MNSAAAPTRTRPIVPKKYAGHWIAWNAAADKIIASGDDLPTVSKLAQAAGELNPSFEKVPPADARIIGAAR